MMKSLIAAVAALSLVTATPASAQGIDREDVGKLLIGLAAVAVIGAAIEQNRDRDESKPVHDNNWDNHNRHDDWSNINRHNNWSNLNRHNRRVLPRDCLRRVENRYGNQRIFGKQCLERNYRYADSLPSRCAVRIYTDDGPRRGFDPRCLRERGYRAD